MIQPPTECSGKPWEDVRTPLETWIRNSGGEIERLSAALAATPSPIVSVSWSFLAPAGASSVIAWRAPLPATVVGVFGYRVAGTGAVVNARKNALVHLSADLSLTLAGKWMEGKPAVNVEYLAGDTLELLLVSVAGGPTQVVVQVDLLLHR